MAREQPFVSVVIPFRDASKYLRAALKSVCEQSYRTLEIIAVNDGSQDESVAILQSVMDEDDRVKLYDNPGTGIVSALNYGISQSSGTYIARMDADDIAEPERIERQIEFLEKNPEYIVCGTQISMIDGNGESLASRRALPCSASELAVLSLFRSPVVHPTALFRNVPIMVYEEQYRGAEDYALWLKVQAQGWKVANLGYVGLRYREHGQSVTQANTLNCKRAAVAAKMAYLEAVNPSTNPERANCFAQFCTMIYFYDDSDNAGQKVCASMQSLVYICLQCVKNDFYNRAVFVKYSVEWWVRNMRLAAARSGFMSAARVAFRGACILIIAICQLLFAHLNSKKIEDAD